MCLWNATTVHAYMFVIRNKKRATHAQWDQLLLTNGASWWHNNGVGEINTQHRENGSRGVEQRDRKKKNENQKWMRWNWVSSHEVQGGHGWSSVTKSRWWHGPQGKSTLATLRGRVTNAKNHWLNNLSVALYLSHKNNTFTQIYLHI